jgi:hypothetical protein
MAAFLYGGSYSPFYYCYLYYKYQYGLAGGMALEIVMLVLRDIYLTFVSTKNSVGIATFGTNQPLLYFACLPQTELNINRQTLDINI